MHPVVHSVGLNPVGYKLMAMTVWPLFKLPAIPELDFSGTVVDANGTTWKTGQSELGGRASTRRCHARANKVDTNFSRGAG